MHKKLKIFTSLVMLCILSHLHAYAQSVLVDFGGLAPSNPVSGLYFNQWNPGNNLDLVLSSDGVTDSGWNLDSSTAAVVNNGISPDYTSSYSGAPSPFADDTVTSDALNLGAADAARNIRFLNLNINELYDVVIYGARDATQTRITDYTVTGATSSFGSLTTSGTGIGTGGVNYNNDTTFTVSGIAPNASGQIVIEYVVNTGDFGYLNAVQLTQIPEPSTLVLFTAFSFTPRFSHHPSTEVTVAPLIDLNPGR